MNTMQKKTIGTMARWTLALLAAVTLTACGDDVSYEYSDYHCGLRIRNDQHQDATLNTAMNSMSPGVFCTITYKYEGAYYYVFENNQGLSSTKVFNAIDLNLDNQKRIGMNNGLIVGFGNLSSPAEFYAYDAECPNCFDINALPVRSYKLSVSSSGVATCAHCKLTYNLNTGGNCTNGSGHLNRYRASTTGPSGTLYVN